MSRRPVVLLGFALPEMIVGQVQFLNQRDDVNAVSFETARAGQVDARHPQFFDLGFHRAVWPRQEAGAHAVGDVSQSQVETRRLNVVRINCRGGAHNVHGRSDW